jgi:restriction system protein
METCEHGRRVTIGINDVPAFSAEPNTNIANLAMIEEKMNEHYAERIGKIYGDFEVIHVEYDWSRRRQKWTLKCTKCGAIKDTYNSADYVKGRSKHCVCFHEEQRKLREAAMAEAENQKSKPLMAIYEYDNPSWIGKTVGDYRILEYRERQSGTIYAYLVECIKCGKKRIVACSVVVQNKTPLCNHIVTNNYADQKYIGRRYGHLVVLEHVDNQFRVKCDCGTEKMVGPANIVKCGVKSCGSLNCSFHLALLKESSNYVMYHRAKGVRFESTYADYLSSLGYNAEKTKTTGDFGVDIIVTDKNGKIAIQCKKYKSAVGVEAVQAVYSGGKYYGCNRYEVVCTNGYTAQAQELAAALGVVLTKYDGTDVGKPVNDRNVYWTIDGEQRSAAEWCKIYGITHAAVNARIKRGMSVEDALKTPNLKNGGKIDIYGVEKTLSEWCGEYGVSLPFVQYRIKNVGMTPYEALTTPKIHSHGRHKKDS